MSKFGQEIPANGLRLMTIAVEDYDAVCRERDSLKQMVSILNDNDNELRQQIDKMKCCGNCYGYDIQCVGCSSKHENWKMKGAE